MLGVRRLWFLTSDGLETWLMPSGTTGSRHITSLMQRVIHGLMQRVDITSQGLDDITSQPWSDAICRCATSSCTYFCVVTPFLSERQDKVLVVLFSRPGPSGEDEQGFEVIGGREP